MLLALLALSGTLTLQRADVSIVPPEPLPLGGYTARRDAKFTPDGDDLKARTLILSQGSTKVALVSLELLTVPATFQAEVKKRLPADVKLILVATHTHGAPDSQMLNARMTFRIPGIAPYDRRMTAWFADQVAQGVKNALVSPAETATEVRLSTQKTVFNRGRRPGAQPDPNVSLLTLAQTGLLHYAAHATLFGEERLALTGDWPGAVMARSSYLVLPGPIGDASPVAPGEKPEDQTKAMAEGLLQAARQAPAKTQTPALEFREQPVELGTPVPHPEFAKANNINDALATILTQRFAEPEAKLTGLLVGQTLLIGVPGEPTAELGRKIQRVAAESGFPDVLVVSHCNGWVGYILMPEDYKKGGYEATLALHGPDLALRIVDAAKKLVAQFPGQSRKLKSKTTRFIEAATPSATFSSR